MKALQLFILVELLVGFASCTKEDDGLQPGKEATKGSICFEIGFTGESYKGLKVATDADFKSTWEVGDEVGVYIVKGSNELQAANNYVDNLKLIYNGSVWITEDTVYYPNDNNISLYAYYPYDSSLSDPTSYVFSVSTNQESTHYNKSDLLLAKAENVSKSLNPVQLLFSHALSLVQVEVKREVNIHHLDGNFQVMLTQVMPEVALNWENTLTAKGNKTNITMRKVEGLDYTYRALIPAQTIDTETKVTFTQTTTGKEINMEYPGLQSATLTAGRVHKYEVTLGYGIDPNHAYAAGDKYPHIGPAIGLVYEVSNGGKNGKVVSLTEKTGLAWAEENIQVYAEDSYNGRKNMKTILDYMSSNNKNWSNFPAFEWIHSLNDRAEEYSDTVTGVWYLPGSEEWYALDNAYIDYGQTSFNDKLTEIGGIGIKNDEYYLSSRENNSMYIRAWKAGSGNTLGQGDKTSTDYITRAIMAF